LKRDDVAASSPRATLRVQGALGRKLTAAERRLVAADMRALLRWQETLTGWPTPRSAIGAIPFVALYVRGQLKACMGNDEGTRGEKLARAFLSAIGDARFGGLRREDRPLLAADVTFMRNPRFVDAASLAAVFEAGTHGLGIARATTGPVFLLPSVARDGRLDAAGMLLTLQKKAGPAPGELFIFDAETVVARRGAIAGRPTSSSGAAAGWLASLVDPDGAVTFAVDARTGARVACGNMHHARSAAVIDGLVDHGKHSRLVALARARLLADSRAALRGLAIEGWPDHPARIAATLALSARAGADLTVDARAYAHAHAATIAAIPWHAAQVATALGNAAPDPVWHACVRDLDRQPWAPWTVLAAHARGDHAIVARGVLGLVAAIGPDAPHRGAVTLTGRPEVAITALTVEALSMSGVTSAARRAAELGREFLARCQLTRGHLPAAFAPAAATGAFLATPTSSMLRGDVTGHALRALHRGTLRVNAPL
jgi:hypothetical protein